MIGIDSRKVSGSVWYLAAGDHRVWSETRARGRAGAGSFTVWTFCLFRWHAAPGERYELLPAVEVQETGVLDKNVSVGAFLREASTNRVVHPSGCTGKRPRLER